MSKLADGLMSDSFVKKLSTKTTAASGNGPKANRSPPLQASLVQLYYHSHYGWSSEAGSDFVNAVNNADSAWVENITVMEVLIDTL